MWLLRLPLEETGPGVAVRVDAAHALVGRRDVEHHDVWSVIGENSVHIAGMNRLGPLLDEPADLVFVVGHHPI